MKHLRTIRYVFWALIAITVGVVGTTLLDWPILENHDHSEKRATQAVGSIGGPFTMIDHNGQEVTEKAFVGRPFVVFFGFTNCPDVCPTTLARLSELVDQAAPEGRRPPIVFVTVDPERDAPETLAGYIGSFGPGIVGLTGSLDQLEAMARTWRVYFKKVPLETGGYTMDHTATIYLMDKDGKFSGTLDLHDATPGNNLKKLTRLIHEN